MIFRWIIILLSSVSLAQAQGKCDQSPKFVTVPTPSENKGIYQLKIQSTAEDVGGKKRYQPGQTYSLIISSEAADRPFIWFKITAEDPNVDDRVYEFSTKSKFSAGSLEALELDGPTRPSEDCSNTLESKDHSKKYKIEIHWVSPKDTQSTSQAVRLRATVAENTEAWYEGEYLNVVLYRDNKHAVDKPPLDPKVVCSLCSEARYEVIFNGKWSRVAHPRHYPTKPDENGYSHMVGASHDSTWYLWQQGYRAREGLKMLVEQTDTSKIEEEIIGAMAETSGTRTLIRGRRRHHPFMSEPSHSLFRVDRHHHLFSVAIGMRPSPDWFLGTSNFELCNDTEWLKEASVPMYPWDAGTMDGVSYESKDRVPVDKNVDRVEIGTFEPESPFYQMNLNDMKPFGILTVRRLDVYPLINAECSEDSEGEGEETENASQKQESEDDTNDEPEEPVVGESRLKLDSRSQYSQCSLSEWGEWSTCTADDGVCGYGFRTRVRKWASTNIYSEGYDYQNNLRAEQASHCEDQDAKLIEYQNCFVNC